MPWGWFQAHSTIRLPARGEIHLSNADHRPLSSTSPVIIEKADGTFYAALGGSGGSRIFGAVAQVMTHLERGLNVSAAVEAPRFHDQIFPRNVSLETGFDRSLIKDLQSKGHKVVEFDINLGIAEGRPPLLRELTSSPSYCQRL